VARRVQVVFDCRDPTELGRFYAQVLHYKEQDPPQGFGSWAEWLEKRGVPEEEWNSAYAIVDPEAKGPRIYFQKMDTPKLGKNRLHIDAGASGGSRVPLEQRRREVDAEVERVTALGAAKQRKLDDGGEYCVVMLDPEGNEFCIQ
jgi:Glyoxalase-like domain